MIERALRLKAVAVRREYGSAADMSDPYVDGVVINAYSGRGTTALRIDELRVDGLVPVGDQIVLGKPRGDGADSRVLRPGDDAAPASSACSGAPERLPAGHDHADSAAQRRAAVVGPIARI